MKKKIIKIIVLLLVFVGGVILFSSLMNQDTTENTADMANPTLPVLCIDLNGKKVDRLYGYTQTMQADFMRDTLVPLTTNREITVSMKTYDAPVDNVTYEVSTCDGKTVVENAKVGNFKEDGEYQTATFSLEQPILMNQEYSLKFTLTIGQREVYYYTRLIQRAAININEYVDFVYNFYEKCTNKEGAADLNNYIEPDETVTNSSFTSVNIHSSFEQITWGSLKPQIYRKAVPTIREINESTGSISLDYMISAVNDNGQTELYHVTEFYRMRYYQSKVLLLDFERTAVQVFEGAKGVIANSRVNLGVAKKTVQYRTNKNADIVAFVQNGDLWSYNSSADKMSRAYSMRSLEEGDERDDYLGHDIKIIRVEESGDIDFVVYGYMNKDIHEGKVGISLCHYNSERNSVEEKVFIPYTKSFEFLAQDLAKLSYVNENNMLYLYLENKVYKVNLTDFTSEVILNSIDPDCFVVSTSQSKIAWMNEMSEYASTNITVMDLELEQTRGIVAADGTKIKALGFINDDFIYGIANDVDIVSDAVGNITYAMNKMEIEAFDGTLVKEYLAEGAWISQVNIQEGLIELLRVTWDGSAYVEAPTDNIMNNRQNTDDTVSIKTISSSRQGTQVALLFSKALTNHNPLVSLAKMQVHDTSTDLDINLPEQSTDDSYYVYAKGRLDGIYTKPAEAVQRADEQVGVVLNRSQQYVWERGNVVSKIDLLNDDILPAFLTGSIDESALQQAVGDTARVMNLTGCTLDEVLYQVSQGRAVVARLEDGTCKVIVGYDKYNTLQYVQDTGEHKYFGLIDSKAMFEAGGNVFVSYVEALPAQ